MATSPAALLGTHDIGPVFGSPVTPTRAPRRNRGARGIALTLGGVAVVAAGCAAVQWGANVSYDDARESFVAAIDDAGSSQGRLEDSVIALVDTTHAATTIQDAETGQLMDAAAREAFAAAVDDALAAQAEAVTLTDQPLPRADEKPVWAWELFGEASEMNDDEAAADEQREQFDAARAGLSQASNAVGTAGLAAVHSAADAATTFEAAHVSARNPDILALRHAAQWLSDASSLDAEMADAYVELESATTAMLASEQEEIAEKQGALYPARVEIEAFARSLAPGVLLDFDWSQIVNGFGEAGSMAGYATWWYADPGYATIELSNSVAEQWPSDRSKALVAHEVGHAISVKCVGMYDDSNQDTVEAWATAWAISMGFTDDANGTSAYGAPGQEMVDAAAGCR